MKSSRLLFILGVALLWCCTSYASEEKADGDLAQRTRALSGDGQMYQMDVHQTIGPESRVSVAITCVEKCKGGAKAYKQDSPYYPVYTIPSLDGTRFISVWESVSAMRVIVYSVAKSGPQQILDESTREWPEISFTKDGGEKFRVCVEHDGCHTLTWQSDGYHRSKAAPYQWPRR